MSRRGAWFGGLAVFWLVFACAFVAAGLRQKERLNLSATAGGQMPYLVYAQKVAVEGVFGHFGDRNRMPLVPVLSSTVYDADWDRFVARASYLSIFLSLGLLVAMGVLAYRDLSPLLATAFLLIVAVTVFAPQASFVQADVPYYALFFCSWWAMSRLVQRPSFYFAAVTGVIVGLTFLTKASIVLALPVWIGAMVFRALGGNRHSHGVGSTVQSAHRSPARLLGAGCVAIFVFLAVVYPYLHNNKERFGRYFYNVNTTFFVWCDSWSQAQSLAEKYAIDQHFPDAPAEVLPGPLNYWRTHTVGQIGSRLGYGLRTLGKLVYSSSAFKYIQLLVAVGIIATALRPAEARRTVRASRWSIAWTVAVIVAYALAYSWYVVVAYGDRFVLSLVPVVLFCLFAFTDRVLESQPVGRLLFARLPMVSLIAVPVLFVALADGVAAANSTWITPTPEFVRFYYDESHEELRRGNWAEARRGMGGVIALDPGFAAAHRDLGMIALSQGKADEAIASLSKATRLEPAWTDVQNSLGSALIQVGRTAEAVSVLERATATKPDLIAAWYNLCGALLQMKERDRGGECLVKLERLSPGMAQQLRAAFPEGNDQSP